MQATGLVSQLFQSTASISELLETPEQSIDAVLSSWPPALIVKQNLFLAPWFVKHKISTKTDLRSNYSSKASVGGRGQGCVDLLGKEFQSENNGNKEYYTA